MALLVVYVILLVGALAQCRHEKYEGHQLYTVAGPSQEFPHLQTRLDLLSYQTEQSSLDQLKGVFRLSPEEKGRWLQYFQTKNMTFSKVADNLAEILRDEESKYKRAKLAAKRSGRSMSWDTYYDHYEVNDYLDELGTKYPNLVTVVNASLSTEGRQIKYVRISTTQFADLRKPLFIIDAAMHAREWLSVPFAMYIINQLVVDVVDSVLTDSIDWVIIPVANPDGYQYSFDVDRMWRKTRSVSHEGASRCPGVDTNRNFDHGWGTYWEHADPCSNTYEGPVPFSEPETRLVRDLLLQQGIRATMYISLHNYGVMIKYPWGNSVVPTPDDARLHLTAQIMSDAIGERNGQPRRYVVAQAGNLRSFFTTGTARDWMYSSGVPFSLTIELPAYGSGSGFIVPPEYIKRVLIEAWPGVAAGAHHVLWWHINNRQSVTV